MASFSLFQALENTKKCENAALRVPVAVITGMKRCQAMVAAKS